jgi:Matrixin
MNRRTIAAAFVLVAAAVAASAIARGAGPPPTFPGHPPPFVTPAGGAKSEQPNQFGGRDITLRRSDGSVYATQSTDAAGRPLTTWFDLGNGDSTAVSATYVDSSSRALATRRPRRHLAASCGNDARNPLSVKWGSTMNWYWGQGSTPGYLNLTNTLTGLRSAHTEWTQVVDWCGIGDSSSFNTSYQGTTTQGFGHNGINTVGWGSVAALGLSFCSAPNTIACTEWWASGSTINESDTRFDNTGRTTWVNGAASGKTDVQSTMAHELGHSAGFDHVNDSTNVMYPTIFTNDTSNRKLGRGDANEDNAKY